MRTRPPEPPEVPHYSEARRTVLLAAEREGTAAGYAHAESLAFSRGVATIWMRDAGLLKHKPAERFNKGARLRYRGGTRAGTAAKDSANGLVEVKWDDTKTVMPQTCPVYWLEPA